MPILLIYFLFGHWFASLYCQTVFNHRYWSHQAFTMNKFWERFFLGLTYVTQGSSFLLPRTYALMHRLHHAYSDTKDDPHSPLFFKTFFALVRQMYKQFNFLKRNEVLIGADPEKRKFLKNLPEVTWFEKIIADSALSTILWGFAYAVCYYFVVDAWWQWFFLPVHFFMGPLQGACVNWFGHKVGYRNYETNDDSRNTIPVDTFLMGELMQNNHHQAPADLNFAKRKFEFDPGYWFGVFPLQILGIAKPV